MARVYILGLMGEGMSVNILQIKKKAMVFIIGQTVKSLKDNGKMETKMVRAFSPTHKVSLEKVCGKTEKE